MFPVVRNISLVRTGYPLTCLRTQVKKLKVSASQMKAIPQAKKDIPASAANDVHTRESQTHLDTSENSELIASHQSSKKEKGQSSSTVTTKVPLKRAVFIKPGVVFKRKEKKDAVPIPNLRKNPVDMRLIPKEYIRSADDIRGTRQSELIFKELSDLPKNKDTFEMAIGIYIDREKVYRSGHTQFIDTCLKLVKEYRVHKDLSTYKFIMSVFPVEKIKAQTSFQKMMMHMPKSQHCAIDILDTMEGNGCVPDLNMGKLVVARFGEDSYVFKKYQRMMYWMPKFRHANPYPVPYILPDCRIEMAKLALQRMAVENTNKITVWKTAEMEANPTEDTFIACAQSPTQKELIEEHSADAPLIVEGGFIVWSRNEPQTYYILRTERTDEELLAEEEEENKPQDYFEPSELCDMFEDGTSTKNVSKARNLHKQKDGTILGMCITGTCSQDSLVTWIRYLQLDNPKLEHIPVLFSLRNLANDLDVFEGDLYNDTFSRT